MILFSAFPFFLRLYGSRHKSILGFVNIHSCINPSGILYFIASKHGIMKFSFFAVKKKIKSYSETSIFVKSVVEFHFCGNFVQNSITTWHLTVYYSSNCIYMLLLVRDAVASNNLGGPVVIWRAMFAPSPLHPGPNRKTCPYLLRHPNPCNM